jgi:hypothetical protein
MTRLHAAGGSCETGAAFAAPVIREECPDAPFAFIWRDINEVSQSLRAKGFGSQDGELGRRVTDMLSAKELPNTMVVSWRDLSDPKVCGDLAEHLTGKRVDPDRVERMSRIHIEIDLLWQARQLVRSGPRIAALKAEIMGRL